LANTLATPTWVMKEIAPGYTNELNFVRHIGNKDYDDQYVQNGAKVGNTVYARLVQRYVASDGQAYQPQALYDQTVPITLTNQKQVGFGYSSAQATTELDDIRRRYVQPAAETLANAADVLAYQAVYRDVWNAVGTPGVTPSALLTYLQAGVKLTDGAVNQNGRIGVLDPLASATLMNTAASLYNPPSRIGDNFKSGMFEGMALGLDAYYVDPNRAVQTTGTFTASTPLIKGAGQTGSTLDIDGWASGATSLKKGDRFTIAGVNSVNPLSYTDTGRLQVFVITADTSDSSGETATLPISPSIITSGAFQTVSASPANDAVVTVFGATSATAGTLATTTSPQSMVFHPDAFAFVMADLVEPNGGAKSTFVRSKKYALSIRYVEQYLGTTDQNLNRLDILIGAATIQARMACIVYG
jgi:coat protein Gp5